MRYELLIAGMGGQGIVLSGIIIGAAASVHAGKNATHIQSYGPEARGGRVRSELVISDEEIDYPRVRRPDLVVVMSQAAYNAYADRVKRGGALIYDPDLIRETREFKDVKVYAVPATRMAEKLGRRIVANIVMIGALTAISGILDVDAVKKAILERVPKGTEELNLKAFRMGYEYGLSLIKGEG